MKQGANRRAARFIISSRAKCTCITWASQGQCDFLLAITQRVTESVGVRLDVIQSSDVKVHYRFLGNRLPLMTKLWVLDRFFHLWIIYVYGRWIITQYLTQIKENGKLNNGGFNKWLEILAGKDLQTILRKSKNVNFKFSASNGTAKAN